MHRVCVLALVIAAACGRVNFGDVATTTDGATADSATGDGSADVHYAMPSVVQSDVGFDLAASVTVAMTATSTSNTIAVAVAGYDGVTSVSDDAGNVYAVAMKQGDSNADTAEIWYAKPGQGSATVVTVTMPNANNTVVWVLELANIDPDAPVVAAMGAIGSGAMPQASAAPLTTTISGTVVIDVGAGGAAFDLLLPGAFMSLELQYGDGAAYDVTVQPGSYAATWNISGPGAWSISAAAFAPARI